MNSRLQTMSLVIARIVIGAYFIGFGFLAFQAKDWSLASFISSPRVFTAFYHTVIISPLMPLATTIFKIACFSIGGLLIFGVFVRLMALAGILLMLFLYFPVLAFPYVNVYLIVAVALGMLGTFRAGDVFSVSRFFHLSRY